MNKKQAKRQRDIKTKLMAAICMLLVSSIMMVSTTYAWFTLSTAPEVTGINTAVGANGNLEMALLPTDGLTKGVAQDFGITSGEGDSSEAWTIKNHTWGNLVDVSDDAYGLNKITLYPAALNPATKDTLGNPLTLNTAYLSTPQYGADGRVSELKADTVTSTFVNNSFPQNTLTGVRAVGTASGMTERQLAYRNARSAASTAMTLAKTTATSSLQANGNNLANIAIKHVLNANGTHTQAEVTALLNIVNDLLGTESTTGVLQYIEEAYINYIVAMAASEAAQSALNDAAFATFESGMRETLKTTPLSTYVATLPFNAGSLATWIDELEDTVAVVEGAKDLLEALQDDGDQVVWGDGNTTGISAPLYDLADINAMTINGIPVNQVKDRMGELAATATSGVYVTMSTGGGVYADVADHCGNYTAAITISGIQIGGSTVDNMPAFMETNTTVTPNVYLTQMDGLVVGAKAPTSAGSGAQPITDMFGYIIDLAFRTNAASSNLLLQTEAVDRIYEGEGSAETMGSGSSMTFTSTTTDFTVEQMKSLMGSIRVVFFDPTVANPTVLATAMLDMTTAVTAADGITVTAKLYLSEIRDAATTYVEDNTENATHIQVISYRTPAEGETATYIADAQATGGYRLANEGETATHVQDITYNPKGDAAGTHREVKTEKGAVLLKDDAVITSLNQNVAKAVSALVYLDGATIQNKDVAATAATSMTGTMNLQFASSANLVPMEYTPLMEQGTYKFTSQVPEGSGITIKSTSKVDASEDYVFTLEGTDPDTTYKVSYKVGTSEVATPLTASADGKYTIAKANIKGDVTIIVEVDTGANGG